MICIYSNEFFKIAYRFKNRMIVNCSVIKVCIFGTNHGVYNVWYTYNMFNYAFQVCRHCNSLLSWILQFILCYYIFCSLSSGNPKKLHELIWKNYFVAFLIWEITWNIYESQKKPRFGYGQENENCDSKGARKEWVTEQQWIIQID